MFSKELIIVLVFTAPLFLLLFTSCFKLDELFAKPKAKHKFARRRTFRPRMPGLDRDGLPVCKDPDGRCYQPAARYS